MPGGRNLMYSVPIIMLFAASVAVVLAMVSSTEVWMPIKGVNPTVLFADIEVLIQLDNLQGQRLRLCFRSTRFLGVVITINDDGSADAIITKMPDATTVTLPNAHIPVATTMVLMTTETTTIKAVSCVILGIVVVFGIIALIIISLVMLYCCWWKTRSRATMPDGSNQVREESEAEEQLLPKMAVNQTVPPRKWDSATTQTTKNTALHMKKPSDEPVVTVASPMLKPPTVVPIKEIESVVSLTSDATQQSAALVTPAKSKASVRKSKLHQQVTPPQAQVLPIEKPGSPSLPVDSTQSLTPPSTLPTPSFTGDTPTPAHSRSGNTSDGRKSR